MEAIIQFICYKVTGIWYFIYIFFMLTFSLACIGVVGEKKAKIQKEELLKKREATAREEYEKAQSLLDKQASFSGIDKTLDPTAQAVANKDVPTQNSTPSQPAA